MEPTISHQEYLKKHKYLESTHHLLIHNNNQNYLLLLHPTPALTLIHCNQKEAAIISTFNIDFKQPIALVTGHEKTICLLT